MSDGEGFEMELEVGAMGLASPDAGPLSFRPNRFQAGTWEDMMIAEDRTEAVVKTATDQP